MGFGHYLFGFSGRINRAKQWAIILVGLTLEALGFAAIRLTLGTNPIADLISGKTTLAAFVATPQAHMAGVILCVLYAVLIYISIAVATKRLHDRNKSAWWLLIFYALPFVLGIPRMVVVWDFMHHLDGIAKTMNHGGMIQQGGPLVILAGGASTIISLWAFVELFCLRGTVGDNRYGPDPLAGRG